MVEAVGSVPEQEMRALYSDLKGYPPYRGINLREMAENSQAHLILRDFLDIVNRNGWGDSYYNYYPVIPLLQSPVEKVVFLTQALQRREYFEARLRERYGQPEFTIQLGSTLPVNVVLEKRIDLGGNRFYLLDSRKYQKSIRVALGFIEVDYDQDGVLIINTIQDRSSVFSITDGNGLSAYENMVTRENVYESDGNPRPIRAIVSKRQKVTREAMKRDRSIPKDPYEQETSGVEELMIYGVLEAFVQSGILPPNAKVMIPKPEFTLWGGLELSHGFLGSIYGASAARNKTLTKALSNLPGDILTKLDGTSEQPSSTPKDHDHFFNLAHRLFSACSLAIYKGNSRKISGVLLSQFLGELIIKEIPDYQRPSQQELEELGLYSNFFEREILFKEFMNKMGMRTEAYMRAFHAYRTAFSDNGLPLENGEYGRIIERQFLLQLPFTNNLTIV